MGPIQSRLFTRLVDAPQEIDAAIIELQGEVNAFLATLPAVDVCEVRRGIEPVTKYGTLTLLWIDVLFLQEP